MCDCNLPPSDGVQRTKSWRPDLRSVEDRGNIGLQEYLHDPKWVTSNLGSMEPMAIEDVLNRIAAGGWRKVIDSTKPEVSAPPATGATPGTLGSELSPVETLEQAEKWALRVLLNESTREFRARFGGDFEPVAGKRYRLISEPDALWVDRCPQGHLVDDRLWLRQCVGIICIECQAVYDPTECQIVPKPMDRLGGGPAERKAGEAGGSSRADAQKAPSPAESPEKP